MKKQIYKYINLSILITILVIIDQITKYLVVTKLNHHKNYSIVKHIFSFEYLENRGVAFGILSGRQLLITIFVVVITIGIAYFMHILENCIRKNSSLSKRFTLLQIICAFLIAGAVGNLIDRIRLGHVIDFIKFDFINFPTFNIADCYVTVATLILFVTLMFFISEEDLNSLKFRK